MGAYDVLATNKILHFVFLAPVLLFLYTFIFYVLLKYMSSWSSASVFNLSAIFLVVFPFYIKYSILVYDDFMEGSRLVFVRVKRKFGKEFINIGKRKSGADFRFFEGQKRTMQEAYQ